MDPTPPVPGAAAPPPAAYLARDAARRLRFTARMLESFIVLAIGMFGVFAVLHGPLPALPYLLVAGVLAAARLHLARHARLLPVAHSTGVALLVSIYALSAGMGGLSGAVVFGAPLTPVVATFVGGRRAGLQWLAITVAAVWLLALINPWLPVPSTETGPDMV